MSSRGEVGSRGEGATALFTFSRLLVIVLQDNKERKLIANDVQLEHDDVDLLTLTITKMLKIVDPIERIEFFDSEFDTWIELESVKQIANPPKLRVNIAAPKQEVKKVNSTFMKMIDWDTNFLNQDGWILKGGTDKYTSFLLKEGSKIYSHDEYNKLLGLFNGSLHGHNFEITRAFAVNNPRLNQLFELYSTNLKSRIERNPAVFNVKDWKKEGSPVREFMNTELEKYCNSFPSNVDSGVKIVPVVHGTTKEASTWGICQTGFANLGWTDDGYFGKGIYFSSFVEYSASCYGDMGNGEFMLIICMLALGNTYPCTENPFDKTKTLMGKGAKSGVDSHFSLVKPQVNTPTCRVYVPIESNDQAAINIESNRVSTEFVIFGESQVLPRYVVFCKRTNQPSTTPIVQPPVTPYTPPVNNPPYSPPVSHNTPYTPPVNNNPPYSPPLYVPPTNNVYVPPTNYPPYIPPQNNTYIPPTQNYPPYTQPAYVATTSSSTNSAELNSFADKSNAERYAIVLKLLRIGDPATIFELGKKFFDIYDSGIAAKDPQNLFGSLEIMPLFVNGLRSGNQSMVEGVILMIRIITRVTENQVRAANVGCIEATMAILRSASSYSQKIIESVCALSRNLLVTEANREIMSNQGLVELLFLMMATNDRNATVLEQSLAALHNISISKTNDINVKIMSNDGIRKVTSIIYANYSGDKIAQNGLTLLRSVASKTVNRDRVIAEGVVDCAIFALRNFIKEAAVQEQAFGVFWHLSFTDEHKKILMNKGAIDLIITAYRTFLTANKENTLEQCSGVLRNISLMTEAKPIIVNLGGIEVIIDVLRNYTKSSPVLEHACSVLFSLAMVDEYKVKIADKGGLNVIIDMIRNHLNDKLVCIAGCGSMRNLANNTENKVKIAQYGGMEVISSVMRTFPGEESLMIHCLAALRSLVINDNNKARIGTYEIDQTLSILRSFPTSADLHEHAACVFSSISSIESSKSLVSEKGAVECLINGLRNNYNKKELQTQGTSALFTLSSNNDGNKLRILNCGGFDVIITSMKVHHSVLDVQVNGCGVLRNCCNHENVAIRNKVAELGGIECMISALRMFPTNASLVESAVVALYRFTLIKEHLAKIKGRQDLKQLVNSAYSSHKSVANIQTYAKKVLDAI